MAGIVTLLGVTPFEQSLILILVSASATGVFGLIIVLIQVHSEKALHERMDTLEGKADNVVTTTDKIATAVSAEDAK